MSIRRPRVAAAALAAATVIASFTAVSVLSPAPAHAAPTGSVSAGTATWGLSTYLNSANFGRPTPLASAFVAPAAFDPATRLDTWGAGTGTVAPDGSADLTFAGTSVNFAATSGAWLRLSGLQADLDASGNGTVSAIVEYGTAPGVFPNISYSADLVPDRASTTPIDLVDLAGNSAADAVVTADKATWTGLDGTWSTELTSFLAGDAAADPAVPAFIYAGQVNANTDRTPKPFDLTVDTVKPAVTANVTGASPSDGVTVAVEGTGFRAVTNAGDAGVYAGLAPSGGLPPVANQGDIGAFAAAAYVTPAQIVDGAFSTTLTAPTDKLDPTKTYSVYTWQAHAHSNTTQDTETPVEIAFADLEPQATTTTADGATTRVYGTTSTLTATVDAPGTVTLTGVGATQTADVVEGPVTFTVPARLAVGSYTATLSYAGNGDYLPSQATRSLTVTKASPKLALEVTTKPTAGPPAKTGKATVVVTGPSTVAAPTGTVTLRVTRPGGKTRTVTKTLAYGKGTVTVPKVGKGRWTVTATYSGSASFGTATHARSIVVG